MQVTYTAGFTPDELDGKTVIGYRRCIDIKYAAIITAAAAFLEAKATQTNGIGAQGPIVMEKLGDAQFQYHEAAVGQMVGMMQKMPWKAQELLRPHQRMQR